MPTIKLIALTPESEMAIGYRINLTFTRFPVRLGRESHARKSLLDTLLGRPGERAPSGVANNDFYLFDESPVKHISREHLYILYENGGFQVLDRGSACGTVVGSRYICSKQVGQPVTIEDGSVIIFGSLESPMAFQFRVELEPSKQY